MHIEKVTKLTTSPFAKKKPPFQALKDVIEALDDSQAHTQLYYDLARLYNHFYDPAVTMPARTERNIAKNLSKFVAVKDVRYYLNEIYVRDDLTAVATNGHTLMLTKNPVAFATEPGFYSPKSYSKTDTEARYPDFNKRLSAEELIETDRDVKEQRLVAEKINAVRFLKNFYDYDYIKKVFSCAGKDAKVHEADYHLRVEDDDAVYIVMAMCV